MNPQSAFIFVTKKLICCHSQIKDIYLTSSEIRLDRHVKPYPPP